ncbi:hypothetical protein DLM75_15135 [Leptospira stimsonii]|uniref:Uncharacterized protein n=1 Tax=Leptospira stimsonii TaxID=2202203 RepID=A0A396Z0Z1_9LEPT|nr:hypothetical protein DLM75_15135 [Leptospira stimsonii]
MWSRSSRILTIVDYRRSPNKYSIFKRLSGNLDSIVLSFVSILSFRVQYLEPTFIIGYKSNRNNSKKKDLRIFDFG